MLDGQSDAAYEAKTRIKYMEHKEKLQEKRDAQERYRMEFEQKDERHYFCIMGIIIAICLIIIAVGNLKAKSQDRKLQATVNQIMTDIKNKDFAEAYVKANSLYWDDSWTSEGEDKWDATRKEIIKQIEEAEKKATGTTTNLPKKKEEGGGFWNWFG